MLIVYTLALFSSAALIFVVQPMAARMLLPLLGGSPAVWNACMLFFQSALLVGYAWAFALTRRAAPRTQVALHATLLAAAVLALPLAVVPEGPLQSPSSPVAWLLLRLILTVGAPFAALAATGPLIQQWFAATPHRSARDPYFLYVASNLGSLGGLLAYPLWVEPSFGLVTEEASLWPPRLLPLSQSTLWSLGYVACAVVIVICGLIMLQRAPAATPQAKAQPRPTVASRTRFLWLVLAAVPSSAMLGATQYISTDIASAPLLWVAPFAIYLLTFMVAFSPRLRPPIAPLSVIAALLVVGAASSFYGFTAQLLWLRLPLHLLCLAAVALLAHTRLAELRPPTQRLTEYYLCIAAGGAFGGAFNALLAPLIFPEILEYPLVLIAACLLRPNADASRRGRATWLVDLAAAAAIVAVALGLAAVVARLPGADPLVADLLQVGVPALLVVGLVGWRGRFALAVAALIAAGWWQDAHDRDVFHRERTFFGVHRVTRTLGPPFRVIDGAGREHLVQLPFHVLLHGSTRHGAQSQDPALRALPTTYFHPTGPVGQVFASFAPEGRPARVGIIGLGAGTLAAYGREGQRITYYEIDPAVVRIARNPDYFTFLSDSRAEIEVVLGDARLTLADAADGAYDLLVLDAFSSDAIPVHLLTREAFELYFEKLSDRGVLCLHLSNRYLELTPVVDALAGALGYVGGVRRDRPVTLIELAENKDASVWAVLARTHPPLGDLATDSRWEPLPRQPALPPDPHFLWTDNYSNLVRAFKILRSRS